MQALERTREIARGLRVILLDLTMPRMNGREALRHIREVSPDVPIVLNSGYEAGAEAVPSNDETRVGFLGKPYRRDDLSQLLSQLLDDEEANDSRDAGVTVSRPPPS